MSYGQSENLSDIVFINVKATSASLSAPPLGYNNIVQVFLITKQLNIIFLG